MDRESCGDVIESEHLTQYRRTLCTLYVSCIHWVLCLITLTGSIAVLNCEVLLYFN